MCLWNSEGRPTHTLCQAAQRFRQRSGTCLSARILLFEVCLEDPLLGEITEAARTIGTLLQTTNGSQQADEAGVTHCFGRS